jgi:hypothetical protein
MSRIRDILVRYGSGSGTQISSEMVSDFSSPIILRSSCTVFVYIGRNAHLYKKLPTLKYEYIGVTRHIKLAVSGLPYPDPPTQPLLNSIHAVQSKTVYTVHTVRYPTRQNAE